MSVYETGKRLKIIDGPITLTAFMDKDDKIAISHALFGLRISPEDLQTVLDELAPELSDHKHGRLTEGDSQ